MESFWSAATPGAVVPLAALASGPESHFPRCADWLGSLYHGEDRILPAANGTFGRF